MVEAGEDLRLSRESGEPVRVRREGVGEDLQRDLAVELGVGGLPDLAHAALAQEGGHVIVPEAGTYGAVSRLRSHSSARRSVRCLVATAVDGLSWIKPCPLEPPIVVRVDRERADEPHELGVLTRTAARPWRRSSPSSD